MIVNTAKQDIFAFRSFQVSSSFLKAATSSPSEPQNSETSKKVLTAAKLM
jgi:hypothetical protein